MFGFDSSTATRNAIAPSGTPLECVQVWPRSPLQYAPRPVYMLLVELILGKQTGDRALAVALDYVRAIRKTPIVVNDSRGFYTSRVVGTYIREGHLMLTEGVPAAMVSGRTPEIA